jgi:hypothetical protein
MDIFFQDPTQIPLPPDEVRVTELRAEIYPDGRRVKVTLALTPFQKRPNLSLEIRDARDQVLAETEIIETMTPQLDLTLHLRFPPVSTALNEPVEAASGEHIERSRNMPLTLSATLFYTPPIQPDAVALPERTVVDVSSCVILG